MKKILIFLFVISVISIGKAQGVNDNEMIGFNCYFSGDPSKTVQKVSQLIDKEKYKTIVKLLDSDNNAERFLAVVVCEKLTELKKLTMTPKLKEKIAEIYNSNEIVSVCSGSTYSGNLALKKVLEKENNIRILANFWIGYKFKQE